MPKMMQPLPYQSTQYKTIILQPSWMQWLIIELPVILLTIAGFAVAGLDGFPLRKLLLVLVGIFTLRLLYTFV